MSLVSIAGGATGTGTVTVLAPSTNTNRTITLPDETGTAVTTGSTAVVSQAMLATNVAGNGPAFSAYQSASTSVSNVTSVKILFGNEIFDTNNNFASSRFTPTVAGYYQISASVTLNITSESIAQLFMNTSTQVAFAYASGISGILPSVGVISKLLYFNGSTDFVEVFSYQNTGGSVTTDTNSAGTWFTGVLVRSA